MMIKTFVTRAALPAVAAFGLTAGAAQAVTVDVELQLLMDVSGSVDATEFDLQRQGYVDAFNDAAVQAAILDTSNGDIGTIAVQFIYWSGSSEQSVAIDWTLLDSATAINDFATAIGGTSRPFNGLTAPGNAISFGAALFENNGFEGDELVMDVSGDGAQNNGSGTAAARDAALAGGIDRINGIYIEGEAGLASFYEDNIAGGPKSFTIAATSFSTFGESLELKLQAEIQGITPDELTAIPLPASGMLLVGAFGAVAAVRKRRRG